jgi:hypothetical protein
MPLTKFGLDTFVAQKLSELTAPTATSVSKEFPGLDTWLTTFVLKTIFHLNLPQARVALGFALLRRAGAAIEDYDEACATLRPVVERQRTVSQYFRALRKFEGAITMLYQAFDFGRKALGTKLFEESGGSPLQRLNLIYNRSRHTDLSSLPAGHLHPVWLQDDGIYTDGAALRFSEIEELLRQLGRIGERVSTGDAGNV